VVQDIVILDIFEAFII